MSIQQSIRAVAILVATATSLLGQMPNARLNSCFPSGGKIGATFDVSLSGADIDYATGLIFSHPDITAVQKMNAATEFVPASPVDNVFTVTIGRNVAPGIYEVNTIGRYGTSTPRAFQVGVYDELTDTDNVTLEKAQPITLKSTVNGHSNANAADYFRLELKQDQRMFVQLWAYRIDSRMDATLEILDADGKMLQASRDVHERDPFLDFTAPRDGVYYIKLYDFLFAGNADYFYRLTVSAAPVVEFAFPPVVALGDSQVTLYGWNLPGGKPSGLNMRGRALEQVSVDLSLATITDQLRGSQPQARWGHPTETSASDSFTFRLPSSAGASNPISIGLVDRPVQLEKEPNNDPSQAQRINVPGEFAGQFFPSRNDDWLQFDAKAGSTYSIEVVSQRLGRPTDPFLMLQRVRKNDNGEEQVEDVAQVDDAPGLPGGRGLGDAPADPFHRLSVGKDATYRLMVRDMMSSTTASPANVYRISIREQRPDFRLTVATQSPFNPDRAQPMRWAPVLRPGGSIDMSVWAIRRDGFNGPIELSVSGLPEGVSCQPTVIGAGRSDGAAVFTAADDAAAWSGPIRISGSATIGERLVQRTAHPAAFIWDTPSKGGQVRSRLTQNLILTVTSEIAPVGVSVQQSLFTTARGGKLVIPFQLARRGDIKDKIGLGAEHLPKGIKAEVKLEDKKDTGELHLTLEPKAPVGEFSFVLSGKTKIGYRRNPAAAESEEALRKSIEEKSQQLAEAATAATTAKAAADAAMTAAQNAMQDAQAALALATNENQSAEAKAAAEQNVAAAQKSLAEAEDKQAAAVQTLQAATARKDAAAAALKQVTDRLKKINESNKPRDLNCYMVSNALRLRIMDLPIATTFGSRVLNVSQDGSVELPVQLSRHYGFADAVRFELLVPDSAKGVSAEAVNLAAGAGDAKLVVKTAPDAATGKHTATVRATFKFNGHNLEDKQIVTVNITPKQ